MVGVAQKANVRAHVVMTAQTEFAVIAVKRGLKCPAVTYSESSNPCARLHDASCGLMSEHHGVDIGSAADSSLGVGMQIGPAAAYGLDSDLQFAGTGISNRHVREAECQGMDKFCCSH